jgi:hypothetical protein
MNKITNIDTLSAYFDRLITENIKKYFFNKENNKEKVKHQELIISEIKDKISSLIKECIQEGKYSYIGEQRTFNENAIAEELEELIYNDINIGEADRARLQEVQKENPQTEKLILNEKRLRKSNEGRAKNKNKLDNIFQNLIKNGR